MAPRPSEPRVASESTAHSDRTDAREQGVAEADRKGLCMNCANSETCLLPRSEGGIWHCEKYVEAP